MTLAAPERLFGMIVIAVAVGLYVAALRSRRSSRSAFASAALLASLTPRQPGGRRHVAPALYAVAGVVLVAALAQPQRTVRVAVEQATVVLVTDHSRSMQAADITPTRLDAARAAASRFLGQVPPDVRVGSVTFNQRAQIVTLPTTDRDAVRTGLAGLRASGGTAAGEGLGLALAAATRPSGFAAKPPPAAIILLTDGRSSNGRDPLVVARAAKSAGVPIHTVALGTASGKLASGLSATSDEATLRAIATASGGHFSSAADANQLQAVYRELGSRTTTRKVHREITSAFAGGGLLLLLAGGAFSLLTFGRLP